MANETAIRSLVERLNEVSIDNRLEALEELKTVVAALSPVELRTILPHISISNVFQCLETENKSLQKVCGEVLDRMLSTLSASAALQNFHHQFLHWVNVQDPTLQVLCFNQLSRISKEAPKELSEYRDLVLAIASHLDSDSLDVGLAAATILTNLGHDEEGLRLLYSDPMVKKIEKAMQKNDVIRFRVFQIATDLSVKSPAALEASIQSGLLGQLVQETQEDDILVQLNAIELVSDLARCRHGLTFLDQAGVVRQLEDMLARLNNDDPMAGLLLPGLIKFFGGLSTNNPEEVLSRFSHFTRVVLSSVDEGDTTLQGVAVETVGFIAWTPAGKLALEKIGNPVTECIHSIWRIIQSGVSDQKTRALQAMSKIIYLQPKDQTDHLLRLTEEWFCSPTTNNFKTVWSNAQQPFPDLRIPSLHLLQNLALTPWGQRLMNEAGGFKEYVVNRATENSKEGKEQKFELVSILMHSPTLVDILGKPFQVKLVEYHKQGPFYVFAQSEVAMEGEG